MTTHVITRRFTAEEAYNFFQETTSGVPEEVMKTPTPLELGFDAMVDSGVYWSKLSLQDRAVWASHRTPGPTWWWHVVHRALSIEPVWNMVVFVRRILQI